MADSTGSGSPLPFTSFLSDLTHHDVPDFKGLFTNLTNFLTPESAIPGAYQFLSPISHLLQSSSQFTPQSVLDLAGGKPQAAGLTPVGQLWAQRIKGAYAGNSPSGPSGPSGSSQTYTSGDIQSGSSGVNQWAPQINDAAKQTGTPAAVIAAIMEGESGGNASAYSPQGATGLMQVMPQYWSDLAKQFGGDLSDPRVNILVGATILKQNHDRAVKAYGSDDAKAWDIAAAAYLGDWSWDKGSYAGNSDAYGTNGSEYVNRFHQNLQKFGGLTASLTQDNRSSSAIGSSNQAIQTAQQFVGQPYVWGGASPKSGFDCSGLVQWSYAQSGYKLPRTAQEQYDATQRVSADQLKPGDLVFFTGTYNAGVPVTHVGIYVGNGKMLDSQNDGIVYDDLSSPYWQSHLYGYGRVT